ncbi:DUF5684 domain-containing protein [Microbacterium testaceum]|uniref:DUF5684 domain-containing protein n=1 Tax=Microbacterium testaceum TaxID=2033 RepID=UPI00124431EF|nr:DUF5684 domain-containing protein [Microbacterium testaceum]
MTDSTMVVLGATSFALVVVLYVWLALALAALFRKVGEASWKGWVPVLNVATVLKLGGFSPWLVLLNLVPLFGFIAFAVVFIVAVHRINTGFGVGAGLTVVGAILPVVWASILGFGSARWQGERRTARPHEDSTPVRRGKDFDGPYVPLIGGWTPEQGPSAPAQDAVSSAPVSPPASDPAAMPFAPASTALADAVPAERAWAPPAQVSPAMSESPHTVGAHRDDLGPAPATSVFDVLDALRDGAPEDDDRPSAPAPALAHEPSTGAEASRPHVLDAPMAGAATWAPPTTTTEAPAVSSPPAARVEEDSDPVAPWVTPPRRSTSDAGAAPIADVPLTRPAPDAVPAPRPSAAVDEFPELSEAVSAVAEAPDAGSPRSARTSVSALYTQPEVPAVSRDEDFDALDRTVVTRRKRIPWALVPPSGTPVDLTSTTVILGRRPGPDSAYPDAQLVAITDETRTVSKTHARLELRGDTWFVTDLHSTNGVLFATLMGTEVEAPPGEEIEAGERFFLGDAEVRLSRSDA